jgi:diguanylate cyclase (GGDEF)-like protein
MNPIIKPVFYLMNQLSYKSKFVLISSLFAIPLALFAGQLAHTYHQQAEQAQLTKTGLSYLRQANNLIEELETLRDTVVLVSWQSNSPLISKLKESKVRAKRKVAQLLANAPSKEHMKYLINLNKVLVNDDFIRGNEAERIDGVYEAAHIMIKRAYTWRAKLAYAYISNTRNDTDIISIINMLNESDTYPHALGQVRTFGSLYLGQKFIESHGIDALEKSYQTLSQLIDQIDLKTKEYESIILAHPDINLLGIKHALIDARELLNIHLFEAMTPTGDPVQFFNDVSQKYRQVYSHNRMLFRIAEKLIDQDYSNSIQQLATFYLSVGLMSLLLIYLSTGIYLSVSTAMRDLSQSAALVATGNYEKPIAIYANDELSVVAKAMDQMRLSIKEREQKLALMSQIDGLTKLYNRPFFDDALEMSLANSRRNMTELSVVMMDIDHFKKVNDTYGHQAGDACLKYISTLMKDQYQRKTDIVARYGGEEFIAILYGQNIDDAKQQTQKLKSSIEQGEVIFNGQSIKFTASFGLASLTPPETADSAQLISLADALLYQSKHEGRNRISAAEFDRDSGNDKRHTS